MELVPELLAPLQPQGGWPMVASLHSVVAKLAGSLAAKQVAEAIAEAGTAGLGAEAAVVAIRTTDGRHFRAVHAAGLPNIARAAVARVAADGNGFIASVGRSRDPVFLPSVAESGGSAWNGSLTLLSRGALVGMPVRRDGHGIGVVAFGWPHSRAFSHEERGFLTALGGLCALAMDRLCLSAERERLRTLLADARVAAHPATHLDVGDMRLDLVAHRIVIGERTISVTQTELALLVYLADEPGRARTRREILQQLWHTEHVGDERVCDAHVSNLRHKIERDPAHPERIVTKRGIGYALQVL
jgi:GAF domain-containing protein